MLSALKNKFSLESALLLAFIAWMAWGIFPLSCYESDNMHLIAGCNMMAEDGWSVPPHYSYFYDMQPLITYVVVGVQSVLSFLSVEHVFCLLTGLASIAALMGCLRLLRLLHPTAKPLMLLMTLFFLPESYACGMYPNSTVPAYALYVWALALLLERRTLWASVLLCIAPLFRIDVVIVYPVLLPLLLWRDGGSMRDKSSVFNALKPCVGIAVAVVAFVALCCLALHADPIGQTLATYNDFSNGMMYAAQTKVALLMFYTPLSLILLPLGVWRMWKRREGMLLLVCGVPMLLLHFFFRNTGCAGKHWLYILPFVVLISVNGWQVLFGWATKRKALKYSGIALMIIWSVVGVRITIPKALTEMSKSFTGEEKQEGPFLSIIAEQSTPLKMQVGIGAGQFVPTADEMMTATGYLFYPMYIHNYKQHKDCLLSEAKAYLSAEFPQGGYDLIGIDWGGKIALSRHLINEGWHFSNDKVEPHLLYELRKGNDVIHCYAADDDIPKDDPQGAFDMLRACLPADHNRRVFILPDSDARALIMNRLVEMGLACQQTERCYELY